MAFSALGSFDAFERSLSITNFAEYFNMHERFAEIEAPGLRAFSEVLYDVLKTHPGAGSAILSDQLLRKLGLRLDFRDVFMSHRARPTILIANHAQPLDGAILTSCANKLSLNMKCLVVKQLDMFSDDSIPVMFRPLNSDEASIRHLNQFNRLAMQAASDWLRYGNAIGVFPGAGFVRLKDEQLIDESFDKMLPLLFHLLPMRPRIVGLRFDIPYPKWWIDLLRDISSESDVQSGTFHARTWDAILALRGSIVHCKTQFEHDLDEKTNLHDLRRILSFAHKSINR